MPALSLVVLDGNDFEVDKAVFLTGGVFQLSHMRCGTSHQQLYYLLRNYRVVERLTKHPKPSIFSVIKLDLILSTRTHSRAFGAEVIVIFRAVHSI